MKKEHVKPVLLSAAQVAALKAIQEQERQKSGFGIAPALLMEWSPPISCATVGR
ncbi:hypothetical protein [Klebsiella pneumoniae]|uniref:hypothetical protein n=1 Tax=Klebsiella pneumoniae TaxID=573 RepID=UPI001C8B214F|nr:hypothetical protein [Klebsiella pneumoniae]MBX9278438.1 hypothetical protein [Klebsiella pneumoniae]